MSVFRDERRILILTLIGFVFGIIAGAILFNVFETHRVVKASSCNSKYPFTNPNLDCADFDDASVRLSALDVKFENATTQYVKSGRATRVSVWARDFTSGQWAASDEFDNYAPASLLKVPLMVAYYKFAQIEPSILDQKLPYGPAATQGDDIQDFQSTALLVMGQLYTVEQLIEAMIEHSDNNAADVLSRKIDMNFFNTVMIELGIRIPGKSMDHDFLTTKTYANIFRQLYNSTYLNREYSEKALTLLSQSEFDALQKSLPRDTKVADKFGEREIDNPDGSVQRRELHDCGIIYKPTGAYSLCVFTEGKDFGQLKSIIEDLSKIAYESI